MGTGHLELRPPVTHGHGYRLVMDWLECSLDVTAGRIWDATVNLRQARGNAIRLPELRDTILFTGGTLVVFRLFANVIR